MVFNMQQRTEEWFAIKRGKFSPSNFDKLMTKGTTKTYNDLINQIVYERFTGKSVESYVNSAMLWGVEYEQEARQDYEFVTGHKVIEVGFITLDEDNWVGCSPDGLVGEDGLLEIKCPQANTQLNYLFENDIPEQYKWQVQGQLYITKRKWLDFYSYYPDLPSLLVRTVRDEEMIAQIKAKLAIGINGVKSRIEILRSKK